MGRERGKRSRYIRRLSIVMAAALFAWSDGSGEGDLGSYREAAVISGSPAALADPLAPAPDPPAQSLAIRLRTPDPSEGLGPMIPDAVADALDPGDAGLGSAGETAIEPPPPEGFGEEPEASTPPPPQLQSTRYGDVTPSGGTWALVIGINDYPGTRHDLRYAVNDADDVNEMLRRRGVTSDRRIVLRDRQASAGVIRAGLDWLTAHAGRDATMVFFFAGHIQKVRGDTEALVGADGQLVTDDEVAALLDRSPARKAWIGLAACYAAGFDEVVKPGRILTAAAPADALAYESDAFGRSYLVEYMVRRAMLGAGITTIEGAFARASSELQRDHANRMPVQFDAVEGDLDLNPGGPSPGASGGGGGGGGGSSPTPPPSSPPPSSPPPSSPPPPEPEDGCATLTVGFVHCSR